MDHALFSSHMDFVFFIYGSAFFFMGLAILIQSHAESEMSWPRAIAWLGLFGVLHGINEWLDMWGIIKELPKALQSMDPLILLVSYVPLFEFGRRSIRILEKEAKSREGYSLWLGLWTYPALFAVIFLGAFLGEDYLSGIGVFSRYTLALFGAILTGISFFWARSLHQEIIGSFAPAFYCAGAAFIAYAILGGLLVPESTFFPASVLGYELFLQTFNVPVQVIRAVCAIAALIGVGSILRLFRNEACLRLKQEQDKISSLNSELEQRVDMRTQELRAANQELRTEVAERKRTEEILQSSRERYRQLFEQAALGILIVDQEHYILDANQEAQNILGYTQEEITRLHGSELIHPEDLKVLPMSETLRRMSTGESFMIERRYLHKSGEYIPVEVTLKNLQQVNGSSQHMIMFHDIVKRKQAEDKLRHLAYYDELTGLPNRALFLDRLQQAISKAKRLGSRLGVLLVDIANLKHVNDALGHQAGDLLIQEVGRRIQGEIREGDTLARIFGDEFMILAEDGQSSLGVRKLGERIQKAVNQDLNLEGIQLYPRISIGYTMYPDNSLTPEELLKQADMAMHEAKKGGLTRIQGYQEDQGWISERFHLEQELRSAWENQEFLIYYQPQVDLQSGKAIGMEALLRWDSPERGLVSPARFIPHLESTGMIVPVSEKLLKDVCLQLKSWQQQGTYLRGSVNISARQLEDDKILKAVEEALQQTGLDPDLLEIELTETMLMQNFSQASRILETISGWGVHIVLDDFGKGYSSLNYLHQLPIDKIKIDKEFVWDIPGNKSNMVLVQAIVSMAHNLGKQVLAEGVESQEQVQALLNMGCSYAQGFLYSRPGPPEEIGKWWS